MDFREKDVANALVMFNNNFEDSLKYLRIIGLFRMGFSQEQILTALEFHNDNLEEALKALKAQAAIAKITPSNSGGTQSVPSSSPVVSSVMLSSSKVEKPSEILTETSEDDKHRRTSRIEPSLDHVDRDPLVNRDRDPNQSSHSTERRSRSGSRSSSRTRTTNRTEDKRDPERQRSRSGSRSSSRTRTITNRTEDNRDPTLTLKKLAEKIEENEKLRRNSDLSTRLLAEKK